jgi:hypothetical protein
MGCELVDRVAIWWSIDDDCVFMRTIDGWSRVACHLSPHTTICSSTRKPSARLHRWVCRGCCAPGAQARSPWPTRLAPAWLTTRLVYAFVPQMIRYYLGEEPMPAERADLSVRRDPQQCEFVLANLDELVVKPANESGGYGMLMGPQVQRGGAAPSSPQLRPCQPAQLHRPAGAGRSRPRAHADRSATLEDRGTSTCGRSSSTASDVRDYWRSYPRRRCARVRWWSTPRRAAAARTPG